MTTSNSKPISGTVERITFHNPDNGFCVIKIKAKGQRELITIVGTALHINTGEFVEASGSWVTDKTYGMQYHADQLKVVPPRTVAGMQKYLASGLIKGIGPHFAKKLIDAFGEDVFEVIEEHPERLDELSGIGEQRKRRLIEAWHTQKAVRDIMVFLQSHGVGTARAVRIYKTYGDAAVELIQDNPYRLASDIHGIGFKSADELALNLGMPRDSIQRAQAGLSHMLQEFSTSGHCAANHDELCESTSKLLEIDTPIIEQAIIQQLRAQTLIAEVIDGEPCYFLDKLFQAELQTAENLARLQQGLPPWEKLDPTQAISWVEKQTELALSETQKQALEKVLNAKVAIITGGPGVGKTTLLNSMLKILRNQRVRVTLAAPTGRAAKRMTEATGLEAKTIHRLLEFDPSSYGFKHNRETPLDTDYLVIDETSMIDIQLMSALLRAMPDHAGLLLVGDIDQLPSVGPGAVLSDCIHSNALTTVHLTEIFRQAQHSKIIVNAHRINAGTMPEGPAPDQGLSDFYFIPCNEPEQITDKLIQVVTQRIPQRFKLDPLKDVQILTPMNRGGLGTRALNQQLQSVLNPNPSVSVQRFGLTFAPGDKIIQMVNNYDKEVFNGDIGILSRIDEDESEVWIEFEGREVCYELHELDEISLAYATTIHKSQGSEYPAVVIPLAMQHYMLLERNLIYTGVTRGRQLVVIIGQKKALNMAVRNQKSRERLTNLQKRLADCCGSLEPEALASL